MGAAVEQGGAVVGVPELVGEAVLVTVGVGRHGGRQGCPVVGEVVLVGEAVGTHGAAVLVAEGVLVAVG